MRKIIKSKSVLAPQQDEPDIAGLISKIQKQLVSLEEKVDSLISRPSGGHSERPFRGEHFSKPSRPFGHSYRDDKGRQDNSSGERRFTQAICAECRKECEIPFKPSADRPVYCRECFAKRKGGDSFREKHDKGFHSEKREFDQRKKPFFRRRK